MSWTLDQLEQQVHAAHGRGDCDQYLPELQRLCSAQPDGAQAWWLLGLALHDGQRHEEALAALQTAVRLQPAAAYRLGLAQLHYETGRPAAELFAALMADLPDDPRVVRNLAGALAAEGRAGAAEAVLVAALDRQPRWLDGQQRLATLRQTAGLGDFDAGYRAAVAHLPDDLGLRIGWFTELAKARQWDAAQRVVAEARQRLGDHPVLLASARYLEAESGTADHRPDLFDALPVSNDPGIGLARVRHALRTGRPELAARLAGAFVSTPAAPMFWPYLSLAWRLLDDPRAAWLDRPDTFIQVSPLDLTPEQLADIAALVRTFHTMSAPYLEQSVRGGTQTDRPLLFRHEPQVAALRAAIEKAVRRYVDALPPPEPDHPLLAPDRDRLRFAGSWSVRLGQQGFHSCHTHPMGWISSACYLALPDEMGPPPAGWLQLGTPPPELKLDLAPYREVAPKPGQLVLFPSTMWHGTVPFADGERLTVAFDMKAMASAARVSV